MKACLLPSFFLLCLVNISHGSWAQKTSDSFSITIKAETQVNGNEFIIDIYKTSSFIKVIYHLRDSVCYTEMKKSPNYTHASKNLLDEFAKSPRNQDSLNLAANNIEHVIHQYGVYSSDSLKINPHTYSAYAKLLDSINAASSEVLENAKYNKNRVVLDGTQFDFIITWGNNSRKVHAHSPDARSNPLLHNLITETLGIYRQIKPGQFLTAKRTSGY